MFMEVKKPWMSRFSAHLRSRSLVSSPLLSSAAKGPSDGFLREGLSHAS